MNHRGDQRSWQFKLIIWTSVIGGLAMMGAFTAFYFVPRTASAYTAKTKICQVPPSPGSSTTPAAITTLTKRGYKVTAHGPMPGDSKLTVWVLRGPHGGYMPVYQAPGGAILTGAALGRNGQDITAGIVRHFTLHKPLSRIYANLANSRYAVHDGYQKAKRHIVVFADPNCYYTHVLWQELRPYVASGKIWVTWLFAPIIHANSPGKAARILTSKDPELAFTENETRYDAAHEEGGAKPLPVSAIPAAMKRNLNANVNWIEQLGTDGTPTILYRHHAMVGVINGVPESISILIHPGQGASAGQSTNSPITTTGTGKACSG